MVVYMFKQKEVVYMYLKRICAMAVAGMLAFTSFNVGNVTVLAADDQDDLFLEAESVDEFDGDDIDLDEDEEVFDIEEVTTFDEQDEDTLFSDEATEDNEATEENEDIDESDEEDTITVKLDANGGVFPDGNSEYTYSGTPYNGTLYISAFQSIPQREGYAFYGWFADPDCTKQINKADEAGKILVEELNDTLYAGWTKKFYTVTFDANGGKLADYYESHYDDDGNYISEPVNLEDTKTILVPKGKQIQYVDFQYYNAGGRIETPDNQTYNNWNTSADGSGKKYTYNLYSFIPTSDIVLYAQYDHLYTVTFKAMEGEFPEEPINGYISGYYISYASYSYDRKTFSKTVPEGRSLYHAWSLGGDSPIHYENIPDDPIAPSEGLSFIGWSTDTESADLMSMMDLTNYIVTGDTIFYANYGEASDTPEVPEDPKDDDTALSGSMKDVKIAGLKTTIVYPGRSIYYGDVFNKDDKICKAEGWNYLALYIVDKTTKKKIALKSGRDYTYNLEYKDGSKKAQLTYTGIGGFTGSIKKTITIKPNNAAKDFEITVHDAVYSKAGVQAIVSVTYKDNYLVEGTDYTISYKNAKKATLSTDKSTPYLVVKGKGNFAGTSKKIPFTIDKAEIKLLEMQVGNITYKAKAKKGYYFAKPVFVDNGKKLTVGKNKDIQATYSYTYAEETKLQDGTVKSVGEEVGKNDKLTGPTSIKLTAQVEPSGDKCNYEGTKTFEYIYKIVQK